MKSTMMSVPLSLNHLLERAGSLFPQSEIVSRLPDKTLRTHSYAEYYRRTRALACDARQARSAQGRSRRHAVLEPPRAPRVLLRHTRPPAA